MSCVLGSTEGCHHKDVLMKPEEPSQLQKWVGAQFWSSPPDPSMRAPSRTASSSTRPLVHGRRGDMLQQHPQVVPASLWYWVQPHLRGHRGSHPATAAVVTAHGEEKEEKPLSSAAPCPLPTRSSHARHHPSAFHTCKEYSSGFSSQFL